MKRFGMGALAVAFAAAACGGGDTQSPDAPGVSRSARTATLETGANLLQAKAPVEQISMYLDGFHAAKDDPTMQMEAHHYCDQVNEDFAQCVLFDGNTAEARLVGVEYIISAALYATLPAKERAYWHPHNYEILSGQLRMPGLPDVAEREALRGKINSYGKTWHTWMTGMWQRAGDELPMGPAHLQWSFNRDGEAAAGLVDARDRRMELDTARAREQRRELAGLAQPQGGVDAMAGLFPRAQAPPPGVVDNGDASAHPVPRLTIEEAAEAIPTTGTAPGGAGTHEPR
jgi:hypothetical protein